MLLRKTVINRYKTGYSKNHYKQLQTVTNRYKPITPQTVMNRYKTLQTICTLNRYEPLH